MSNPVEKILKWFRYEHLPLALQEVSKPVGDLAEEMAAKLPMDPETTAGLRKLLEAKDCFVRAAKVAHDARQEASSDEATKP